MRTPLGPLRPLSHLPQATEQVPSVTGGRGSTPQSGSRSAPVGGRGPRSPLRAQRDDLLARDPPAHRHEPDSVSQTRIATRQLRSPRGGPAAHAPARPPRRYATSWGGWGRSWAWRATPRSRGPALSSWPRPNRPSLVVGPVGPRLEAHV